MNKKRIVKLLFYLFLLQFLSIIFALLIEKFLDLLVKIFNMSLGTEILLIVLIMAIGFSLFYSVYKQICSLLLFDPIAKNIMTDADRKLFYEYLLKVKNNEKLTDHQKAKLNYYIIRSPLPKDFLIKQTSPFYFTLWTRIVILLIFIYLYIVNKLSKDKNNEPNRNSESIPK